MIIKKTETGWGRDQFVRIYQVKKGFIRSNLVLL